MITRTFDGKSPKVAASALVADNVYLIGDVEIGEYCNIWPGVVIRGDTSAVRIGDYVCIEENSVLHTGAVLEGYTVVGHGCLIEGSVGLHCLVGNTASIMPGAKVGSYCTLAAGTVVVNGREIPDYSFVAGVPGVVKGRVDPNSNEHPKWNESMYTEYQNKLVERYKAQGIWSR